MKKNYFIGAVFVLLLTACAGGGGGGGGGGSSGASMPPGCCSLYQTADVQAAYADGYTGKGVTLIVLDHQGHTNSDGSSHQGVTMSIAGGPGGVATGANLVGVTGTTSGNWTNTVASTLAGMSSGQVISIASVPSQSISTTISVPTNKPNIVIAIPAGNERNNPTLNRDLINALYSSQYKENLLIVGGIDPKSGSNNTSPAGAASDRYVVDNGWTTSGLFGSSNSAPRVAGYAAIIQQKFPNSTGAQIAQAILDTAIMKPGWDPAVYGRGQANLAGALSPQGKLK